MTRGHAGTAFVALYVHRTSTSVSKWDTHTHAHTAQRNTERILTVSRAPHAAAPVAPLPRCNEQVYELIPLATTSRKHKHTPVDARLVVMLAPRSSLCKYRSGNIRPVTLYSPQATPKNTCTRPAQTVSLPHLWRTILLVSLASAICFEPADVQKVPSSACGAAVQVSIRKQETK